MSLKITQLPSVPAGTITDQISIPVSKTGTDPKTYKMSLSQTVAWLATQGIGTGAQGPAGPQGTGAQGAQGSGGTGPQGPAGPQGFTGSSGYAGVNGNSGYSGFIGSSGYQGVAGNSGYSGFIGSSGFQGAKGDSGYQGFIGSQGFQGVTGQSGYQGSIGSNTGQPGPGLVYTGDYRNTSYVYYNSTRRKDVVSYSGAYYLANSSALSGDAGYSGWQAPGTVLDEWANFGTNFKSVATGLLLTEDAAVTKTITLGQTDNLSAGIIRTPNANGWINGVFNATNNGFWLGNDAGYAKFFVGDRYGSYLLYDSSPGNRVMELSGTIYATAGSIGGVGITQGQMYTGSPSGAGTLSTPVYINGSADPGGNTNRTYFTLGDRFKFYRVAGVSTPTTYMAVSGIVQADAGSIGGVGIAEGQIYTGSPGGAGTTATPFYLNGSADVGGNRTYFTLGDSFKSYRVGTTNYIALSGIVTANAGSIGGVGISEGQIYTGSSSGAGTTATPFYLNGSADVGGNRTHFTLGDSFKSYRVGSTNYVALSGIITANAGSIGGVGIGEGQIYTGSPTGAGTTATPFYVNGSADTGGSRTWMTLGDQFKFYRDGSTNKLVLGDYSGLSNYLSWDGTGLVIKGTITVTGGDAATQTYASGVAATAQSNAISTASGDATTKANAAYNNAKAVADAIANGTYSGGTLISGTSVISPVIAGNDGYFSGKMTVGSGSNPITLDATTSTRKIYIGNGTYNNSGCGFYVDGTGNLSLGDKLTFTGGNLSISGAIKATSGYIGGTSGGWAIGTNTLTSDGNQIVLNSSTPSISVGSSTSKAVLQEVNARGRLYVTNQAGITTGILQGSFGAGIDFSGIELNDGGSNYIHAYGTGSLTATQTIQGNNLTASSTVTTPTVVLGSGSIVSMSVTNNFGGNNALTFAGGSGDSGAAFRWVNSGNTAGLADLTTTGEFNAYGFNVISSRKWKDNIKPIINAMDTVSKLQGVTFDWNNKDCNNDFGLIAEEVNEVLPTIVGKRPDGTVTGVDYGRITALLIETVKELNEKIKRLERQVNS